MVETLITELNKAAEASGFVIEEFGRVGSHPLTGYFRKSANPESKRILLSSGIHGDEPASVQAILRLLEQDLIGDKNEIRIAPLLNPSGLEIKSRFNKEGLDLNRDFRQSQSNEIRSYKTWLRQHPHPDLSINLHEDWEAKGFYLYVIAARNGDRIGRSILDRISEFAPIDLSESIDDHIADRGLILPANQFNPNDLENWPEAIFLTQTHPHVHCTIETPSTLPIEERIKMHIEAVLHAINYFESLAENAHSE